MAGTSNYQAGVETSEVVMSYGAEAQWGVLPEVAFQALRFMSEGFQSQKQRTRPAEVNPNAQASAAVTQSVSVQGSLNCALSYGTYDDLLASLMMGSWGSAVTINGVSDDISFVAATGKITSTSSGKFANVQVGMWLDIQGCSINPARMFRKVVAKTSNQDITTVGKAALVDETPAGAAVKIRNGGMLRNNAEFHSLYVQKDLGGDKFLCYPGSYVTQGTLNNRQGNFSELTFTLAGKSEKKATTNASTGAVLAAPTGKAIDAVAGMQNLLLNDAPVGAIVQELTANLTKEGAAAVYGMGDSAAGGMNKGTFTASGTVVIGFKTFDEYDLYKNETVVPLNYANIDKTGAGYMHSIPAAVLTNPQITASGPNQTIFARFNWEADPHAASGTTCQIDRFAAPA